MQKLSLVLVHQPECQDIKDFEAIAAHVRDIAPEIDVFIANNESRSSLTRKRAARNPSLVFSPGNLIDFCPDRGKLYAGRPISKILQMRKFLDAGIAVPDFVELEEDTYLDRKRLGDIVLLKGSSMMASNNVGTDLFRLEQVRWQPAHAYPVDHPGHYGPMFVQRFIDTGAYSSYARVLTLFGEPLIAYRNTSTVACCSLNATDDELQRAVFYARRKTGQIKELIYDEEIISLARKAYSAFPDVPLQACDIVRDGESGTLYLLEINPGGNTWIFSRPNTPLVVAELGGVELTAQFDAFRKAALLLVEKTRAEAE